MSYHTTNVISHHIILLPEEIFFFLPLITLAGSGSKSSKVEASFEVYSTGKISTRVDIIWPVFT